MPGKMAGFGLLLHPTPSTLSPCTPTGPYRDLPPDHAGGRQRPQHLPRPATSATGPSTPRSAAFAARFVHLVATDAAPHAAEQERLAALLTYGDLPPAPRWRRRVLVVTPAWVPCRPGPPRPPTLPATAAWIVRRVRLTTEYRISLLDRACWANAELTAEQLGRRRLCCTTA